MVFITVPGVVTHKVPFIATPDFNGEYNFNIHGLHYIDASEEFRRWNKEKQVKTSIQNSLSKEQSRLNDKLILNNPSDSLR
jgi:hypothetical protein